MVPENCVSVEPKRGIKPKVNSLFPVTLAMSIDIGLNRVRLTGPVPQKLEIKLITNRICVRVQLRTHIKFVNHILYMKTNY